MAEKDTVFGYSQKEWDNLGFSDKAVAAFYHKDGVGYGYKNSLGMVVNAINTLTTAKTNALNYKTSASQASLQSVVSEINAQNLNNSIDIISRNYQNRMNEVRKQNVALRGQQEEAMSANGFEVGSGSYQDILMKTDFETNQTISNLQTALNIDIINTQYQAKNAEIQSKLYKKKSEIDLKMAKNETKYGGISAALQGLTSVATAYGKYKYDDMMKGKKNGNNTTKS